LASAVFLRLEGAASEGITVDGGHLSKAGKLMVYGGGATKKAVKPRA